MVGGGGGGALSEIKAREARQREVALWEDTAERNERWGGEKESRLAHLDSSLLS